MKRVGKGKWMMVVETQKGKLMGTEKRKKRRERVSSEFPAVEMLENSIPGNERYFTCLYRYVSGCENITVCTYSFSITKSKIKLFS